jgi:NAD(P)-dependent dehydrogenase (short-subunit alcohol dehydrogenase family)
MHTLSTTTSKIHQPKNWALVTGGSSGIGMECVKQLVIEKNYKVIFTYCSNNQSAENLCRDLSTINQNRIVKCYKLDLNRTESILNFVNQLKQEKYVFDTIIHSAGVGTATIQKQLNINQGSDYNAISIAFIKINVLGALTLQNLLTPLLNVDDFGSGILFVGSVGGGDRPFLEFSPEDSSSKAYLDFLVKDLAMRNLRTNIHVVRLNPGATDTCMLQESVLNKMSSGKRIKFIEGLPKKRLFSASIVARAILHHVDPNIAALYHGASITASGGLILDYAGFKYD